MHAAGILLQEDIICVNNQTGRFIRPLREDHLQPSSYDVSVSQIFDKEGFRDFDELQIQHLEFVNLVVRETIEMPLDVVGHIYLRSTYARLGLGSVHLGRIEAGWIGRLVIEVFNASRLPIKLTNGERIATVEFVRLNKPVAQPYAGQFQGFGT